MPRKKLSEYRAKSLLEQKLGRKYQGIELSSNSTKSKIRKGVFVVKVDQAVKKRGKNGLIKLNQNEVQAMKAAKAFFNKGYDFCLAEPFMKHDGYEQYLSLRTTRSGLEASFNPKGGVDVESEHDSLVVFELNNEKEFVRMSSSTGIEYSFLKKLTELYLEGHFVSAEINPLVRINGKLRALDFAVEVDDAALGMTGLWDESDLRFARIKKKTEFEERVEELNNSSQSSFRLEVLNTNGSLFMLLSGGGASIALADEVYNHGAGDKLANYGEYSGAPNREETMIYSKQIIDLLLKSKAKNKKLIIAGGVANFTDVKATFNGIIDAFRQSEKELKRAKVKVYVRRGGPNEKVGLQNMESYLERAGLLGVVYGSEASLTDIVNVALKGSR